jgi:hypothetical protein
MVLKSLLIKMELNRGSCEGRVRGGWSKVRIISHGKHDFSSIGTYGLVLVNFLILTSESHVASLACCILPASLSVTDLS